MVDVVMKVNPPVFLIHEVTGLFVWVVAAVSPGYYCAISATSVYLRNT